MAQSRKPSNGRLAGVALGFAAIASLVAIGFSPDRADASVASQGAVSISPSCYDLGFGSILAVLTSPLGMVQGLSGSLSAWVQGPHTPLLHRLRYPHQAMQSRSPHQSHSHCHNHWLPYKI